MNNPHKTPQEKLLTNLNTLHKMFPKPPPTTQLNPELKPIIKAINTEVQKLAKSIEEISKHLTAIHTQAFKNLNTPQPKPGNHDKP